MSWNTLDPHYRSTAERVLTSRQLRALQLREGNAGWRTISLELGCSITTARDLYRRAKVKVDQAMKEEAA